MYKKYSHHSEKKTMETRIIKNIFNKNERRFRDVKTQKACERGWEANIGPKTNHFHINLHKYSSLYRSGLFNFGSYVSLPTLFTCFLGFDVPTSSFIFIENVFYFIIIIIIFQTNHFFFVELSQ